MKKVLVVEDERTLRDALVKKLSKEEFTVLSAKDGKEGLDTALAEHPDLILLDILMPKMNGIEVLQKLREDEWGAKAKVIVLTVLNDQKKILEALEKGAYEYLVKSDWKLEDIVERVKEKLQ
ncbi:response regulator [bacterium]|jgi:two-component system, OmpR family, alkaline phosphatase synthesis response regulator PhoP|nr:response regulator [bacterium]MBT4122268.1 response regulator [bacterium]MBT4335011.1 response regulator [bacterium]MBT4495446.1 response regulator [bacterium]MBT4763930.1 response regulator [bacterium]